MVGAGRKCEALLNLQAELLMLFLEIIDLLGELVINDLLLLELRILEVAVFLDLL